MLHRLRLLLACLVLAVVARPAATALEVPRAVAAFIGAARAQPADTARPSAAVPAAPRTVARTRVTALPSLRSDVPSFRPSALGWRDQRGDTPLFLTQQRFLL